MPFKDSYTHKTLLVFVFFSSLQNGNIVESNKNVRMILTFAQYFENFATLSTFFDFFWWPLQVAPA